MTIMPPVSGFSLATLARLAALQLPLPDAATPSSTQSRSPDVVVFSSAPFRLLSDLASAGLKQLVTLLPALEQALQENAATPIGHLAKAAAAAARQITNGHVALLAEGPERVAASLRGELPAPSSAAPSEARQALRTLARQLGTEAEAEPASDAHTGDTPRTVARQLGTAPEPAPDARTSETLRTVARQLGTTPEAAPDTRTSEAPRIVARQPGPAPEPAPDARTSETLRTVARQIGMAERPDSPHPSPADSEGSPIRRWLGEAELVLRSTGEVLDRAEQRLTAQATTPDSPSVWALGQIAAAQAQVTAAHGSIRQSLREPRRIAAAITAGSFTIPTDHLAGATTMFGMLLVLVTLWLAGGIWSLVTGAAGLIAVAFWVMRISRASSGIRLDPQR